MSVYDLEVDIRHNTARPYRLTRLDSADLLRVTEALLAAWGHRAPQDMRALAPAAFAEMLGNTGTYVCETQVYRISIRSTK